MAVKVTRTDGRTETNIEASAVNAVDNHLLLKAPNNRGSWRTVAIYAAGSWLSAEMIDPTR